MRLTQTHAQFWLAHLAPEFIRATVKRPPDVNDCVNAHVAPPRKRSMTSEPANTLNLVRLQQHNFERGYSDKDRISYLWYLLYSPHSDRERVKWVRRWLTRASIGESRRSA